MRGHSGQVQAVAWSPDGERLASADRQGFVKVWGLAGGKDKPLFETGPIDGGVGALAWSLDGKHLAAVCRGKVRLWDGRSYREEPGLETDGDSLAASPTATGGDIMARQVVLDTWIASLTWSPDGSHLALGDVQGKLQIWDVASGKKSAGAQQGGVHSAAWSPHGNRLASVGGYGVITVWDPPDYKGKDLTNALNVKDIITGGATSGFALAWADDDRLSVLFRHWQIRTLDTKSGAEVSPRRTLSARDRFVGIGGKRPFNWRYVWAPGGKLLASVPAEGYMSLGGGDLKTWDAATGKALLSFASAWHVDRPSLISDRQYPTGLRPAWDPDGRRLALGDDQGNIRTWDATIRRQPVRTPALSPFVNSLAWDAGGRGVLCVATVADDDLVDPLRQGQAPAAPGPGPGPRIEIRNQYCSAHRLRFSVKGEWVA